MNEADFLNQMLEMSFYQLSNVKNAFGNVLDLIFVNELGDVEVSIDESQIVRVMQQDRAHVPYEITFTYCKKTTTKEIMMKEIRCYKSGHYERMKQQIEWINFQHEINNRDVDSAFDFFGTTMTRIMENNIPTKTIAMHSNRPVWWTKELQALKNRRDKLF